MSINFLITDARKRQNESDGRWFVMHPSNDAILATADTEEEADMVIVAFNVLAEEPI